MDVAWLHKYALELVWKEAEDKQTGLEMDGGRGQGSKGEKRWKRKEERPNHQMPQCAFSSLPSNASWVKSIVHVLFMPMHLSSVICVWRPNSGLSEIETGSGDTFCEMLHIKCSVQAQFSTAASYLVAKLRAQSHQTLSKMLRLLLHSVPPGMGKAH